MIQIVTIGILLTAAFFAWLAWRRYRVPSIEVCKQVRAGFWTVQRYAVTHVDENIVPVGPPGPVPQGGRFSAGGVATFVYSASAEQGMFIHMFSGKLHKWRPKEWLIACMLLSMLEFERQLKAAGIASNKEMKQLAMPPTGTVFVQYVLTPEQHERFLDAISTPPATPGATSSVQVNEQNSA